MPRKMAYCPSAVRGAVTRTTPTAKGIDVTVTATDPEAARTIVALAELHARFPRSLIPFPGHFGLRSGGSRIGFCPIVHEDTSIKTTRVPDGVRIRLRARSPERVRELQTLVEERAARLRSPSS